LERINWSQIIFKGLESDVLLITDMHLINDAEFKERIYVEASREKHSLFVYEKEHR